MYVSSVMYIKRSIRASRLIKPKQLSTQAVNRAATPVNPVSDLVLLNQI